MESPADAVKQFSQSPGGAFSLDAVRFIKALKLKGQLPGIATNTVAGIAIPGLTFSYLGGPVLFSNTNFGKLSSFFENYGSCKQSQCSVLLHDHKSIRDE